MQTKYREWIAANVVDPYGKCEQVTKAMAEAFPELVRVRGHYYCMTWGERAHWWLLDPGFDIVDPTADQFPSKGIGVYAQYVDGDPLPTGPCQNCRNMVYDGSYFCSNECGEEAVRELMKPNPMFRDYL